MRDSASQNRGCIIKRWCSCSYFMLFLHFSQDPITHDGSMVLVYMLTWLGYIDGIHVTIYSSTMDPMGKITIQSPYDWALQEDHKTLRHQRDKSKADESERFFSAQQPIQQDSQPWKHVKCESYKPIQTYLENAIFSDIHWWSTQKSFHKSASPNFFDGSHWFISSSVNPVNKKRRFIRC
jgi:hypothetical protein